ncbi:acyltransferase family protein [Aquimarina megaterium]|uniref:acyltransferase family protein n=1 Tax=Aquimarina megaterium TaxID=1443666 RepID=UPI00046F457F|nr:acyltransferase family protein [Aquimarina megaterium]
MKKLDYIDHIDALRAIAVLLVILFHLDFDFVKGGFIGVDVFFVISGFLITRILKHEYETTSKISFKNFYSRRVRRLLPSLFLMIFLVFIAAFLIFAPSDFMRLSKVMLTSSVAVSNFFFLSEAGYFDISANLKPLLHTWSLGIEEQFYLIWPITLVLLFKIKQKVKTISVISFLFLLSLILTILTNYYGAPEFLNKLLTENTDFYKDQNSLQFFLLPFRIFEFLIGASVVWLYPLKIKSKIAKEIIFVIGIILLVLPAMFFSKDTPFLSTLNIIPCIGVAILIVNGKTSLSKGFFENNWLRKIGNISYTWYLFHWPFIVFYKYIIERELNIIDQLFLFILPLLVSLVVYKYYETPLRYKTYRISIKKDSSLVYFAIICILLIVIVRNDVIYKKGWTWRISDTNIGLAQKLKNPEEFHKKNYGGYGFTEMGFLGKGKGNYTDFVLIGDSHARHYAYGLVNNINKNHKKSITASNVSAFVMPGFKRKGVDDIRKVRVNYILEVLDLNPQAIPIMSYDWYFQMEVNKILNDSLGVFEDINISEKGYEKVINKIKKFHKLIGNRKTILIGNVPRPFSSVPIHKSLFKPKYLQYFFPVKSVYKQDSISLKTNTYLKNYADKNNNIYFLDPVDVFCNNGDCIQFENGEIYYSDGSHLSKEGSLKFVEYYEKEILRILEL